MMDPKRLSELRTRAGVGGIFAACMLLGVLVGPWLYLPLFAFILWRGCAELLQLKYQPQPRPEKRTLAISAICVLVFLLDGFLLYASPSPGQGLWTWYLLALAWPLWMAWHLVFNREEMFRSAADLLLPLAYLLLPFLLQNRLCISTHHYTYAPLLGILLFTWSNDTFAYLSGMAFGRTPFYPAVSPKKTWEGTLGGILVTCLGAYFWAAASVGQAPAYWVGLALVVAVTGSIGDLIESAFKRQAGVKDSGSLMPGHGGILDRFDAFVFCLPFAFVYHQAYRELADFYYF